MTDPKDKPSTFESERLAEERQKAGQESERQEGRPPEPERRPVKPRGKK